ncbi:MAG: hypothetical protein AAF492_15670, partial [Verrucomicrobiota bacterium]
MYLRNHLSIVLLFTASRHELNNDIRTFVLYVKQKFYKDYSARIDDLRSEIIGDVFGEHPGHIAGVVVLPDLTE